MTTEPVTRTGTPAADDAAPGPAAEADAETRTIAHAADLMNAGRLDDAQAALTPLADTGSPAAAYALGMLHIRRSHYADAIRVLGQAADSHPDHVRCHLGLAQAQERAGVRDAALHSYQRVLSLDPGNPTAATAVTRLTTPAAAPAAPAAQAAPAAATVSDLLERPADPAAGEGGVGGNVPDGAEPDALRGAFLASYRRRFGSHLGAWTGSAALAAAALMLLTAPDTGDTAATLEDSFVAQATWRTAVVLALIGAALLLHALTSTITTRYEFRERAVDVRTGVLFRRKRTVWLWDTAEIALHQPLWHSLTGTAELLLFSGSATLNVGRKPRTRVTGFAPAAHVEATRIRLQTRALYERRAMKKQWI